MDVCTLIVPTMVNLFGCFPASNVCHFDLTPHTQREFCSPAPTACKSSEPYYQCVREDKTTYILDWSVDKGPIEVNGPNTSGGSP